MGNSTLNSLVITQAIALVCFVVVPVVITLMVPVTDLEFRKEGSAAAVTVKRYALLFVPWQTIHIEGVKQIRADLKSAFRYPDTAENRRKGRAGAISHATGRLAIVSAGPEVLVEAAPELAKSVVTEFEQFVSTNTADPVQIPVYASWSLSYLLGGAVSFLCALHLFGAGVAVLKAIFKR